MNNTESQMNAIKLSSSQHGEDTNRMSEDGDSRVHKCPNCGHDMPMDEVEANADAYKLAQGQEGGKHMDEERDLG